MGFKNVIGQNDIINSLENNININKISHANLFIGQKGIGKRTIAKLYAKNLLCSTMDSCGECISCKTFMSEANPDFKIVEPTKKSIGVDIIRNLQKDISIMPIYGDYKVYIIVEANLMTVQAQNCLLKTLEEPPEYMVIILTTENVNSILETVISRSTKFYFKRNSREEVEEYVNRNFEASIGEIKFAVSMAEGIIGNAVKILNREEFLQLRNDVIKMSINLIGKNYKETINAIDVFDNSKDSLDDIFLIMNLFYRDILVYLKTKDEKMLINSDKKDIIINILSKINSFKIERDLNIINETRKKININANFHLSIEVMLLKLQEEII